MFHSLNFKIPSNISVVRAFFVTLPPAKCDRFAILIIIIIIVKIIIKIIIVVIMIKVIIKIITIIILINNDLDQIFSEKRPFFILWAQYLKKHS